MTIESPSRGLAAVAVQSEYNTKDATRHAVSAWLPNEFQLLLNINKNHLIIIYI